MITLHTLFANVPHSINPAKITEVVEARFGGCGILFSDKTLPVHFWESREQVLKLMGSKST
jgi:hypothetical protein